MGRYGLMNSSKGNVVSVIDNAMNENKTYSSFSRVSLFRHSGLDPESSHLIFLDSR
jgi:hypothetical protein